MRGIGPCYRDKVGRSLAVRLGDMYRADFRDRIEQIAAAKNEIARPAWRRPSVRARRRRDLSSSISGYAERLRPHVADTTAYLLDAVEAGQAGPVRGRPGRAAGHRPRHVPVRHQQQQLGRGRLGRLGRARPLRRPR